MSYLSDSIISAVLDFITYVKTIKRWNKYRKESRTFSFFRIKFYFRFTVMYKLYRIPRYTIELDNQTIARQYTWWQWLKQGWKESLIVEVLRRVFTWRNRRKQGFSNWEPSQAIEYPSNYSKYTLQYIFSVTILWNMVFYPWHRWNVWYLYSNWSTVGRTILSASGKSINTKLFNFYKQISSYVSTGWKYQFLKTNKTNTRKWQLAALY